MRALLCHLRAEIGPDQLIQMLDEVGERRSEELLTDDATWSSFDQFKNLCRLRAVSSGGMTRWLLLVGGCTM